MRLAIVGSRYFTDYDMFKNVVDKYILDNGQPDVIISGGAAGADTLAKTYSFKTIYYLSHTMQNGRSTVKRLDQLGIP